MSGDGTNYRTSSYHNEIVTVHHQIDDLEVAIEGLRWQGTLALSDRAIRTNGIPEAPDVSGRGWQPDRLLP
jgi:hypothetical protein